MSYNNIEHQFKQREKEAYLAEHIFKRLLYENCSMAECNTIIAMVQKQIDSILAEL